MPEVTEAVEQKKTKTGRPPKYLDPLMDEMAEMREMIKMIGGKANANGLVPPGVFFMHVMCHWIGKMGGPSPADEMLPNALAANAGKIYDAYVRVTKAAQKQLNEQE